MIWQEVMNTKVDEPSNSMRIDIPKNNVLPAARRDDAARYTVAGFLDPEPPSKLIERTFGTQTSEVMPTRHFSAPVTAAV